VPIPAYRLIMERSPLAKVAAGLPATLVNAIREGRIPSLSALHCLRQEGWEIVPHSEFRPGARGGDY
jgi:hypothetical protein